MTRRASLAVFLSLLTATLFAQSAPSPSGEDLAAGFTRDVRPLLETYCLKCHGPQKKKGGIDFSRWTDGKAGLAERRLWKKALLQVEENEMPPEGEKPLAPEARTALLAWVRGAAHYVDCSNPAEKDPGPPL